MKARLRFDHKARAVIVESRQWWWPLWSVGEAFFWDGSRGNTLIAATRKAVDRMMEIER